MVQALEVPTKQTSFGRGGIDNTIDIVTGGEEPGDEFSKWRSKWSKENIAWMKYNKWR